MLLKMRDAEKRAPMGTMLRNQRSQVIWTLWTPSRRWVVRSMILVPMVAKVRCHVVRKIGLRREGRGGETIQNHNEVLGSVEGVSASPDTHSLIRSETTSALKHAL